MACVCDLKCCLFLTMSHFTCEEDDKLIEAVAAHPALSDMKHVLYKDQHAKDNIWGVIAGEVGKTCMPFIRITIL